MELAPLFVYRFLDLRSPDFDCWKPLAGLHSPDGGEPWRVNGRGQVWLFFCPGQPRGEEPRRPTRDKVGEGVPGGAVEVPRWTL